MIIIVVFPEWSFTTLILYLPVSISCIIIKPNKPNNKSFHRMNETDERGHLPLDLALATAQYGIAKSLVEHQVTNFNVQKDLISYINKN